MGKTIRAAVTQDILGKAERFLNGSDSLHRPRQHGTTRRPKPDHRAVQQLFYGRVGRAPAGEWPGHP